MKGQKTKKKKKTKVLIREGSRSNRGETKKETTKKAVLGNPQIT
jgi:hypothetical protein